MLPSSAKLRVCGIMTKCNSNRLVRALLITAEVTFSFNKFIIFLYWFTPLCGVGLWKKCHERSEFQYCNYDSSEASVIISIILIV